MKQLRVIQRLSSLTLAMLLLLTAVWGQSGLAQQRALTAKKQIAEESKAGKGAHSDEAQLSATQFEAVVTPALQIGGSGQTFFLLPAPTLVILMLLSVPLLRHFAFPHYFFAYFRHVFGCAIAPNAP